MIWPDDFINKIICGDCLTVMKEMPDKCIDLVLTDPPYGTTACKWDTIIPFEPMWEQLKRITKKNGAVVLFGSQPFTSALVMSNLKMFRYEWIWDKKISGNPLLAKHQPLKIHENICVFSEAKHNYYPQMSKGKMRMKGGGKSKLFNMEMGEYRNDSYYPVSIIEVSNAARGIHPTQKPIALFEYLIKTYTSEGDLVLDNCLGSGTTAVAAKNLHRNFIGIEINPEYCAMGKERLAQEVL